ncbi:MAG TPA: amidohydrolase family protein, partial [Bryobacteraceae bacterium]|nr:amidohydrolase family protein [Bryobacteraceae bacterium]
MAKTSHPSRRGFLGASAAAAAAAGIGPASNILSGQNRTPIDSDETLALVNGRIHTMDAANTIATSVTIRNGRFVALNAAPAAAPGVRTIDLGGRTVVPGLVEPHIHIVSLGNRPGYHTILENTASIREIQEALAARRKNVPPGAWITSMGGWHPNQWAEHRHPTLAELDAAVPDRPVLLYERFTGPCATNSLG